MLSSLKLSTGDVLITKVAHQIWRNVQASQPHCNHHSAVERRDACYCNKANETISVAKAALAQVHDSQSMALPFQHHDDGCYTKQLGSVCAQKCLWVLQFCSHFLLSFVYRHRFHQTREKRSAKII